MTIKDIKRMFGAAPIDALPSLIAQYASDERAGVQSLIKAANRRLASHDALVQKMQTMAAFDASYPGVVIGLDEAGRGPLAGPVVTAACIIAPCEALLGLDDSKKLSPKKREALFDAIKVHALYWDVSIIDNKVIDDINILEATKLGMKKNLKHADISYDTILTDYVFLEGVSKPLHGIVKGDQKSLSIAAASVLAKVTRDRIMCAYDETYPAYGFKGHKGYGARAHCEAIKTYGATPIHRMTFLKNILGDTYANYPIDDTKSNTANSQGTDGRER